MASLAHRQRGIAGSPSTAVQLHDCGRKLDSARACVVLRRMDAAYWRQWMDAVDDAILAVGSSSTPFVLAWPSRTIHDSSAQLNFILLSPVAVCPLVCSSIGYMLFACIPCWCVCNAVCRHGSAVILFHIGVPVAASPSMVLLFVLYFFTSSLRRATLSGQLCCSYIDL